MRAFRVLAGVVLFMLAVSVWALSARHFPAVAKRGIIVFVSGREITVDGQARRLSAGHSIWNQKNRLDRPTNLIGERAVVNYTEDRYGNINRIWILTPEEVAQTPEQQRITPVTIQEKTNGITVDLK